MRLIDADELWMEVIHTMDYCDDILEIIEHQKTIEPTRSNTPNTLKTLDCVGRQEAIEKFTMTAPQMSVIHIYEAVEILESMPSAQPEPKTGKWEWDENAIDWGIGAWICSECKNDTQTYWSTDKANDPYEWGSSQYCPNCGAKMQRGEQDE